MPVVNNDILKLVAEFTAGRQNTIVQNSYHFRAEDIIDGDEPVVFADLATAVRNMMVAVEDFFNTEFVLRTFRVVNLTQASFVGDGIPVAWAGADISNDDVAAQVACEVLARSFVLGHTGRKYLGPTAELSWQDGVLTAPALAAFVAYKDLYEATYVDIVSANTYTPGTWNPNLVPTFRAFTVGRGSVVNVARTMRSRIPGRGLG
jgi:hypothetical protein